MIKTPLHHCYLVSAENTAACTQVVKSELEKLLATSQKKVHIEADTTETLTIEMARQLRERGQQKSANEIRCFIKGFGTATTPAQNALLKIIEAPASGVHFFFVTSAVDNVLDTVRSRAWHIPDICTSSDQPKVSEIVERFIAAKKLSERLEVLSEVKTRADVRELVRDLSNTDLPRDNEQFGNALESVADWSRDSGASVKLLTQLLAITADKSSDEQ